MSNLQNIAQEAIARAKKDGASAADVMIREDDTFSVTVRMGEVETLKEAISRSLMLRVFIGKRTATSHTSDLSPAVVDRLVQETVEMARLTSEDQSGGLPEQATPRSDFPNLDLLDTSWETLTPDQRIDLAMRTEAAALATDKAITNSEGASFEYARSKVALANTIGFSGQYEGTGAGLHCVPIAQSKDGMQRDHWMSAARHRRQLASPEEIGKKAAERALRRMGARKIPTCHVPVIFDPLSARSLVSHVFEAISGSSIYRRSSFLVDQIGNSVASPNVTIVDDALIPAGLGSSPFDDEGVPTQTTAIIENGVLRNYLHTAYTARKLGAKPTGSGSRAASGVVTIGPTNFYLKAGPHSPEEILGSVKRGLYVMELIGFGVNTVSGDYSRGAVGIWIEDGKLTHPVQEVTIAGNLREMLKNIEMIGNDVTFIGSVAAPTLKIGNMVISGA
ncbi:MAG TPA: TldD/PmbA family protein [Terriglobia bacterium]|nr:TldD/PmbA family protein [Terriglobia bacterium]